MKRFGIKMISIWRFTPTNINFRDARNPKINEKVKFPGKLFLISFNVRAHLTSFGFTFSLGLFDNFNSLTSHIWLSRNRVGTFHNGNSESTVMISYLVNINTFLIAFSNFSFRYYGCSWSSKVPPECCFGVNDNAAWTRTICWSLGMRWK